MKSNHLVTGLLVLILSFVLSGCAGMSTKSTSDLSCTTVDMNAMIHSGNYQRKADNFIIIQDATISMNDKAEKNSASSPPKLAISKGLVRCLNNSLPENFDVKAGMRVFGSLSYPNDLVYGMSHYSKAGLEDGVLAVKASDSSRADGVNPIGEASNDLKQVSGRTAVILFSDGVMSEDNDPVAAAAAMKKMYGENVCIYTVILGDNPNGKTTMEEIASQGGCGFAIEATNLYMRPLTECNTVNVGKGMGDFVSRVFLEKALAPSPPSPPEPVLDSDGDGVPDSRDKCPDTPKGVKVDKEGCPIPLKEKVSVTLLVGFDFDRTDIKAQYNENLEKVANLLKAYPEINVELEGHTDSIGTDEYNMDLARRRAESVKKELTEKYNIDASRMSTSSFGESKPVDTNDTADGRQNNRRVVAQIEAMIDK